MNKENDGRRDCEFFCSTWKTLNRRLVRRLEACTEWEELEATASCRPILGGIGNVDSMSAVFPDGTPFEGGSYRLFNPSTGLWSIYWAGDRSCELFPPVIGRFDPGIGEFHGTDTHTGKPVKVVFHWTEITPTPAPWQQSFPPPTADSPGKPTGTPTTPASRKNKVRYQSHPGEPRPSVAMDLTPGSS